MRVKFGVLEQTQGLHLCAKFYLNVCTVSASGGQKPQFWAHFDFSRAPVPTPFYRSEPNLACYSRPMGHGVRLRAKFHLDRFILSPSVGEKPQFLPFFGLRWCHQLAAGWESWTCVHNYKPSPIQRHQNRFCTPTPLWQNGAHNLWCSKVWWTDKQTNKQTKKLNVFGRPGGGWNPSPTKLSMVIEDLEHVLAPLKLLGVWRILLPLLGHWKFGYNQTPST